MLHVSLQDLISKFEDIDRKRRLSTKSWRFYEINHFQNVVVLVSGRPDILGGQFATNIDSDAGKHQSPAPSHR